jgi:hypothetical protein
MCENSAERPRFRRRIEKTAAKKGNILKDFLEFQTEISGDAGD